MSTPEEEIIPCPRCEGAKVIEVHASMDPAARLIEECCPDCDGRGHLGTTDQKAAAAVATLERLGYTHTGGELWRGPLGKVPNFDMVDHWRAKADELSAQVEALTKYIRPVYLVATGEVHDGQETYTRHDAPVPMADQEVLFTRPPNPLTRPAVPTEMAGIFREALAWGRVWGPLLAGNLWDDMREEMVSEFARRALSSPKHQEQANLPDGWVPCTLTFDRGYPEDVAYGPQRMMERLQKWLGKHFAREIQDSLKDAAGEAASPEAYAPLTPDEVRDLTCMQAGAPWADAPLGALAEVIAIYEQLRQDGKRPVDPSTLPEDQVRFPYVATQPAKHPDDQAIDRFAAAMKAKMAEARNKGCYGWEECPPNDLSWMLREHVDKGDPRDVANFCMMLWHLGASIAGPMAKHQACGCVLCTCQDDGQCHGCGAKHCGTHPVGQFSNPARESCHQPKADQKGDMA